MDMVVSVHVVCGAVFLSWHWVKLNHWHMISVCNDVLKWRCLFLHVGVIRSVCVAGTANNILHCAVVWGTAVVCFGINCHCLFHSTVCTLHNVEDVLANWWLWFCYLDGILLWDISCWSWLWHHCRSGILDRCSSLPDAGKVFLVVCHAIFRCLQCVSKNVHNFTFAYLNQSQPILLTFDAQNSE